MLVAEELTKYYRSNGSRVPDQGKLAFNEKD
jgi:hypothetical protein